ncbi:MAG: hypothetical protein Q8N57_02010 [bacterium]|nr:hypothetical protein [bacterium]
MLQRHNFVDLAEVQIAQGTLYCGGLDLHPFGGLQKSLEVYASVITSFEDRHRFEEALDVYRTITALLPRMKSLKDFPWLLASLECYVRKVIDIGVCKCNIRSFKPQSAFYEQLGPAGMLLLARLTDHIKTLEESFGIRIINLLDCKRGDILTTQAAYFRGLMGNLQNDWGIDYAPYDFDIINVTPWMGDDVLVLEEKEKELLGLQLMRQGKGIIIVNLSSNDSGPQYQKLMIVGKDKTLHMCNAEDLHNLSVKYDLEYEGLSTFGMVVGSTHLCDGSIRKAFPGGTLLVPGFGAQGGDFSLIMLELINSGKWNGQGAIFSSSRGTMFPFLQKLGGSGLIKNLEPDLIAAVANFRKNEKKAYEEKIVKDFGIVYPFAI